MGVRFLRNGSSNSGNAEINLYVQQTEPEDKNGIWLQEDGLIYEDIIGEYNLYEPDKWNTTKMSTLSPTPYSCIMNSSVAIGTDVYLFGGQNNKRIAYKYNTLTDTYTRLTDIPTDFDWAAATSIGTNIYLFGSYSSPYNKVYRYDTLTDTYTKLRDLPKNNYCMSAVVVDTNIYLVGGYSNTKDLYKYNSLTNTYTQLASIPQSTSYLSAVAIGNYIYMFCSNNNTYKYDTLTNTYTKLTDSPIEVVSATNVDTDVYIFGTSSVNFYKYNVYTDTFIQLDNMPYSPGVYQIQQCVVNGNSEEKNIYLFGGYSYPNKVQIYTVELKDYPNNSIILSQGVPTYHTNLLTSDVQNGLQYYFNNAWHYTTENKLNTTIPTYYGNGTSWVKFKN